MLGLSTGITTTYDNHTYASSVAFKFDGSYDYVKIPDHADFNHVSGSVSRFTVSLWFKHLTGSGTLSSTEVLAGRWDLNDKREWFIYLHTDRYVKVAVSDDGTSGSNIATGTSTYQVSDTDWHHLFFRYDGSKTDEEHRAHVIIDGVNVLGVGVGTPDSDNFAELNEADQDTYISATQDDGTAERYFTGSIDEVCYWKGTFHKGSSLIAAQNIYNNGKPKDMRHAGGGNDTNTSLIGYWKMGEFFTAGCAVPSGTYPISTTNPHDSSKYNGSCGTAMLTLNYAGGAPVRTGANLVTNGNFADGGPALASDETDETVNGWQSYTSSTGAVVTTDTSIYRSEGKSAKITTDADGVFVRVGRNTNASLEDGECYVLEYWFYSPTDMADAGGQEWARSQCEVDACIEGDAQYGLSGDGNVVQSYIKINQWTRIIVVGKHNRGSDAVEMVQVSRQFGNLDPGEGPAIYYFDDISVYKITGSHHGLVQSPGSAILDEGVDE